MTRYEKLKINCLEHPAEAEICAKLMACSEPWITLQRGYHESLQSIQDDSKEVYLAILNDQIIGFVILVCQGVLVGYIQSIYVLPTFQGRGIGTKLMKFSENRLFREFPNVFIFVSSFNPDAQKLYKRLGYEVVGEIPNFIIQGESEILLRKTISPLADFHPNRN